MMSDMCGWVCPGSRFCVVPVCLPGRDESFFFYKFTNGIHVIKRDREKLQPHPDREVRVLYQFRMIHPGHFSFGANGSFRFGEDEFNGQFSPERQQIERFDEDPPGTHIHGIVGKKLLGGRAVMDAEELFVPAAGYIF